MVRSIGCFYRDILFFMIDFVGAFLHRGSQGSFFTCPCFRLNSGFYVDLLRRHRASAPIDESTPMPYHCRSGLLSACFAQVTHAEGHLIRGLCARGPTNRSYLLLDDCHLATSRFLLILRFSRRPRPNLGEDGLVTRFITMGKGPNLGAGNIATTGPTESRSDLRRSVPCLPSYLVIAVCLGAILSYVSNATRGRPLPLPFHLAMDMRSRFHDEDRSRDLRDGPLDLQALGNGLPPDIEDVIRLRVMTFDLLRGPLVILLGVKHVRGGGVLIQLGLLVCGGIVRCDSTKVGRRSVGSLSIEGPNCVVYRCVVRGLFHVKATRRCLARIKGIRRSNVVTRNVIFIDCVHMLSQRIGTTRQARLNSRDRIPIVRANFGGVLFRDDMWYNVDCSLPSSDPLTIVLDCVGGHLLARRRLPVARPFHRAPLGLLCVGPRRQFRVPRPLPRQDRPVPLRLLREQPCNRLRHVRVHIVGRNPIGSAPIQGLLRNVPTRFPSVRRCVVPSQPLDPRPRKARGDDRLE